MPHLSRTCRGFLLPLALVLAAAAALAVDLPIARMIQEWNSLDTIHSWLGYFGVFEPFGQGMLGLPLALIAIHQLDPQRRWAIPRVIACTLLAGGAADLLKMLVARTRPYELPWDGSIWTSFGPWLPLLGNGSEGQSFPSGHTATAAGLAAALVWLYPNGRLLFPALAILVGCHRIVSGAHYLSDVLMGAGVGCLVALFVLEIGRLPVWFARWEARWKAK